MQRSLRRQLNSLARRSARSISLVERNLYSGATAASLSTSTPLPPFSLAGLSEIKSRVQLGDLPRS